MSLGCLSNSKKEVTDLMVISSGMFYVVPTFYLVYCRQHLCTWHVVVEMLRL